MPAVRVQLCAPLASERAWIEDLDERFAERIALLSGGPNGLETWLLRRVGERAGADGGRVSWSELRATDPRLAEAGARWLRIRGHALPDDARRCPEAHFPLTEADWGVLIADHVLHGLAAAPADEARRLRAAATAALATIGLVIERGSPLPGPDPALGALAHSAAKPAALVDALAAEDEARGEALRAVVLVDGPGWPEEGLPLHGGGPGLLAALTADERLVDLRPALLPRDDPAAIEAHWRALDAGEIRVLVVEGRMPAAGAASANVVADLRPVVGRATVDGLLADDGALWEIVCADPTLRAGDADYRRLVARHGDPSALHPALTAAGPPPVERFAEINLQQRDAATGGALGAPPVRGLAGPPPRPELTTREKAEVLRQAVGVFGWLDPWSVRLGAVWLVLGVLLLLTDSAIVGVPWALLTPVWVIGMVLRSRTRALRRRYPRELPLEWAVFAVCEAYRALGELPAGAAERRRLAVEPDGTLRLELPALSGPQRERVAAAVAPLVTPGPVPRLAISRAIDDGHGRAWYPVPDDLARDPRRAAAFVAAWRRWAGPGWIVALDLDDAQTRRIAALAQRPGGADDGDLDLPELPEAFGEHPLNLPALPERPAPATPPRAAAGGPAPRW